MSVLVDSVQNVVVDATTAQFANAMPAGETHCLISTVDCWVRIGATGGAATVGGTGSFFLPSGTYVQVLGNTAATGFVNVIRNAGNDGKCSLIATED